MRRLIWIAMLGLGCVHTNNVMLPDGSYGVSLDCPNVDSCMYAAQQSCPHGYEILASGERYAGTVVTGAGSTAVAQNVVRPHMIIKCTKPHDAANE